MSESKNFGISLVGFAAVALLALGILKALSPVLSPAGSGGADMTPTAVAARIAPVGQLNTGDPIQVAQAPAQESAAAGSADTGAARSGEQVYNTSCMVCHAAGIAGAPKLGDAAEWAPRIGKGMDTLMQSAINGTPKGMPPRGTCANCSDEELQNAVTYMVEQSS